MTHRDRRQDILKAAMELFAKSGFRGTTTRDLAAHAEINEASIFRYFRTKEELYRAILEEKVHESHESHRAELEQLALSGDDKKFLETLGRTFIERHEQDTTFMRLLLFSALEGHELSDMFLSSMGERDPLAQYFQRRIDEGAFRPVDPHLAARAFFGSFASFVQWQEIFGLKKSRTFEREHVVQTFVGIFLAGMKA